MKEKGMKWMLKQKLKEKIKATNKVEHDVWITKCLNYSDKYGIGYQLSNGIIGVHFNDLTKLCLDPNFYHLDYFELNSQKMEVKNPDVLNVDDYPETIPNPTTGEPESFLKKMKILVHFGS